MSRFYKAMLILFGIVALEGGIAVVAPKFAMALLMLTGVGILPLMFFAPARWFGD